MNSVIQSPSNENQGGGAFVVPIIRAVLGRAVSGAVRSAVKGAASTALRSAGNVARSSLVSAKDPMSYAMREAARKARFRFLGVDSGLQPVVQSLRGFTSGSRSVSSAAKKLAKNTLKKSAKDALKQSRQSAVEDSLDIIQDTLNSDPAEVSETMPKTKRKPTTSGMVCRRKPKSRRGGGCSSKSRKPVRKMYKYKPNPKRSGRTASRGGLYRAPKTGGVGKRAPKTGRIVKRAPTKKKKKSKRSYMKFPRKNPLAMWL